MPTDGNPAIIARLIIREVRWGSRFMVTQLPTGSVAP